MLKCLLVRNFILFDVFSKQKNFLSENRNQFFQPFCFLTFPIPYFNKVLT